MRGSDLEIRDGFIISREGIEPASDGALIAFYSSRLERLDNDVRMLALMCMGKVNTMFESDSDFVKIVGEFILEAKGKGCGQG